MNWLHYLLEANIYLAVFYAFYCLFLNKETHYTLNRVYLLLSCTVAFILPLVQVSALKPAAESAQQTYVTIAANSHNNTTPALVNYQPPVSQFTVQDAILYLYITGMAVMALLLLIKIGKLIKMTTRGNTILNDKYKLIGIESSNTAFSFFNYLFIGTKINGSDTIIRHELVHIKQKHSADIIFIEILRIVNWFNPIIYFVQISLKTVHEYIADEQTAVHETDAITYSSFLVDNAYGIGGSSITHSFFNYNLLKKRIIMLNQKRSGNLARLKYLVAVPICAGMLCASTLAFSKDYALIDLAPVHHQPALPTPADSIPKVKSQQNDTHLQPPPPPIFVKDTYVDLFNYLNKTITYPKSELKTNQAGLVALSFDVKAQGKIANISITKNAGTAFNQEVLQALKTYPGTVNETVGRHKMIVYFCTDYYKFIKTPDAAELKAPDYDFSLMVFGASKYPFMPPYKTNKKATNVPAAQVEINHTTKLPPPPPPAPPVSMQADTPIHATTDVFNKYVARNVRYPAIDRDKKIGGRVIAAFDVVDGKINDPQIVRGVEPVMDGELLRAIKAYDGTLDLKDGHYSIPTLFQVVDYKGSNQVVVSHLPEANTADKPAKQSAGFSTAVSLNEVVIVAYPSQIK
ncbi:energy transducer TonB [Mucilaginibacter sp. KACC 22773]|uniref:energy transducer TonB n=1 Tax=Mucilaginibacter sp. KACC 22773 TaxID=3025671 RepID=UPI00236660EA|nr:energy transducer TonB [Mucilaginibacter sp. KACC 22773]WDF80125.1 energy transducer TonB [Mucilaginibacter sp. KACC 22773]